MKGQRDVLMDNIKALLLFLVAFGHTLDVYKGTGGTELYIMKYVYLFHMPMFAFITGYFTKNPDKARSTAVEKCLIPYLLFQGIYIAAANIMIHLGLASFNSTVFNGSVLVPSSAFYYLLAVFFWKIFAKDMMRTRWLLPVSIVLGVIVSVTRMDEFHIGYGAAVSLLPFFVLGLLCSREIIQKIRKIPKLAGGLIMAAGAVPAIYLPYAIHSVRMTYSSAGFSNIQGILYRLAFYLIAFIMGIALICLMGEKESKFTQIGKASILVYAGSTFLAPHGYIILDKVLSLSDSRVLNMAGMIAFSFVVAYLCSIPFFLKWYNNIVTMINKLIFKG